MLFCRTEKIGWKCVATASVASRRPSEIGCGSAGSGPDLLRTDAVELHVRIWKLISARDRST